MGQSHLGSDLPAVDRLQQTGAIAMDSLHPFDDWGIHWKDDHAFFSGKRVWLECISFDGTSVMAKTVSNTVPLAIMKCKFPDWVASYMLSHLLPLAQVI